MGRDATRRGWNATRLKPYVLKRKSLVAEPTLSGYGRTHAATREYGELGDRPPRWGRSDTLTGGSPGPGRERDREPTSGLGVAFAGGQDDLR